MAFAILASILFIVLPMGRGGVCGFYCDDILTAWGSHLESPQPDEAEHKHDKEDVFILQYYDIFWCSS